MGRMPFGRRSRRSAGVFKTSGWRSASTILADGACKAAKTTPLLSIEKGMEAMRKAGTCGYKTAMQSTGAAG